jgi:putative SOS response-associated peptidase YedK
MCGRFTQSSRAEVYEKLYGVACPFELVPRFNVAPSQPVLALRESASKREFALLSWGLVPHWASDPTAIQRPINARAESVAEKPAFRDAFRTRRALVPSEIFYEWLRRGGKPLPFAFKSRGAPISFAAVWDHWQKAGRPPIESLSLIVGPASELVAPIHDRMPVVIPLTHFDEWLDSKTPLVRLHQLLSLHGEGEMERFRVGPAVNNARNEGSDLIVPWRAEE